MAFSFFFILNSGIFLLQRGFSGVCAIVS